ncbi:MAG: DUF2254 domain-containing protein [Gemmatimonadetes bacterium]|nr:DUF2254 domain-containing protein [Gemmatimonadota bacterium]
MGLIRQHPAFGRQWALPIIVLAAAALLTFWGLYTLDHILAAPPSEAAPRNALERFLRFDPESLTDAFAALATVLAAVFGIVIMVVSIIVQLSSERYTGVARLFLRDPVNLGVMGFYVVGCVTAVWLSMALQTDFVPRVTAGVQILISTAGLILMAPYFGYVFWFLDPINIVVRLRREAVATASQGALAAEPERLLNAQRRMLMALEELTDITNNSISGKDKIIASDAVDALKDFALEYLARKPHARDQWFRLGEGIRMHPDFVAMDPESLRDLEQRRTWVEWKVMRQYLGIYNDALATMRDINYLIAIDTRYLGEAAAAAKDEELIQLVFRFMNSYMRATLNARDVRTAYNVLNQYRLLVEAMLRDGNGSVALQGVGYMSYYGHLGLDMKLTFVTETVAYDVAAICEAAHEIGAPEGRKMLDLLLALDPPSRKRSQEDVLLGVRKAQLKLAAYYLMRGDEALARLIGEHLAAEPRERLLELLDALQSVTSKDFWEITDRGRNFDYLPEAQRAFLPAFLALLDAPEPVPVAADPPGSPPVEAGGVREYSANTPEAS